ncbi:MAG: ABC transporter substrate-binding protein [Candidatus Kerfeldbacteria bacterium]
MFKKMSKVEQVLIIVAIIVICFLLFSSNTTETRPTIKIGYNSQSVNYGPMMIGIEKGYFENDDYNIEVVALKSGKDIRQGAATGQLDLGLSSASNFFTIIAADAPVKIIAPVAVSNTLLFVRPDDGIETFEDLKGKVIQGGKSGQSEFVFVRALKIEGIDISEIEFLDIDKGFRPLALMEQKVLDAIPGSSYNKGNFDDFGIAVHKEWVEKGYGDTSWPNTVIATNTEFLENNNEVIEFILGALIKSHEYFENNTEDSAQLIADHINRESLETAEYTKEEVLISLNSGLNFSLWYDPSQLVDMAQTSFESGALEKNLTQDDLLDLRYEELLKKAQDEIYDQD